MAELRVVTCQDEREPHLLDDACVDVTDVPEPVRVRILAEVHADRPPLGWLP